MTLSRSKRALYRRVAEQAQGGKTEEANLWLACPRCNSHKADRTAARDPESGRMVRLFNPRRQIWANHFAWSPAGDEVVGKTATGRATVQALHLNRAALVAARRAWIMVGWHPPAD